MSLHCWYYRQYMCMTPVGLFHDSELFGADVLLKQKRSLVDKRTVARTKNIYIIYFIFPEVFLWERLNAWAQIIVPFILYVYFFYPPRGKGINYICTEVS